MLMSIEKLIWKAIMIVFLKYLYHAITYKLILTCIILTSMVYYNNSYWNAITSPTIAYPDSAWSLHWRSLLIGRQPTAEIRKSEHAGYVYQQGNIEEKLTHNCTGQSINIYLKTEKYIRIFKFWQRKAIRHKKFTPIKGHLNNTHDHILWCSNGVYVCGSYLVVFGVYIYIYKCARKIHIGFL